MENNFDPMTGKPIANFDPMTGQPINQENPTPDPAPNMNAGFDPMTGKPINQGNPTPNMNAGFDPMTGMPITPKKAAKSAFMIPAIVVAGVVVVIGVVATVKGGVFLSKAGKVELAMANTIKDQSHLTENLSALSVLQDDSYTINVAADIEDEDISFDAAYASSAKQKQLSGTVDFEDVSDLGFVANLTSSELQLQVPEIDDQIFIYNYVEENDGYITEYFEEDQLNAINQILSTIYSNKQQTTQTKEVAKIINDAYKDLKFEKADEEKYEVDGKDRKCKGYSTTVTSDDVENLMDNLETYYDDNYSDDFEMYGMSVNDYFDEITDDIDDMPDMDFTFYIYKNKLACILVEADGEDIELMFLGGDTRMQNMELDYNGHKVAEIVGEASGSTESYKLKVDGEKVGTLEYDFKSGDYEIAYNYYDEMTINGNLQSTRNSFTLTVDSIEDSYDSYDLNGVLSIKKGADFQKLSGDTFDIGNADEDDFEDLYEDLYDELEDADIF